LLAVLFIKQFANKSVAEQTVGLMMMILEYNDKQIRR